MNINLYSINEKFDEIQKKLFEAEEVTPEISNMIEALEMEKNEKLEAIAGLIKNTEAEIDAFKAEICKMENRKAILERRVERFQDAVKAILPIEAKWEGGVHKMHWRGAKSIEVTDLEAIPIEFVEEKVTVQPNKKVIAALLKSEPGLEIPGVQMIEKFHLQVK